MNIEMSLRMKIIHMNTKFYHELITNFYKFSKEYYSTWKMDNAIKLGWNDNLLLAK